MIVETSTHPQFVSNTFLVADGEGGPAFFVDAGGPVEPLLEAAERLGLSPSHVLLTHHHFDHVSDTLKLRERWPGLRVLISPTEHELLAATGVEVGDLVEIEAGERLPLGRLEVQAVATPGHTSGMLSFVISEHGGSPDGGSGSSAPGAVFTGDTLFKDSVGGVRAPGHSTYEDLRESIMGTLMQLPPEHRHLPRPRGHHDGRPGVGVQPLHPCVAGSGPRGHGGLHGPGSPGHARAPGPRLRRRDQGLGPLGGRQR